MTSQASFLGSLFDLSFSRFVTLRLVKLLDLLAMIMVAVVVLAVIIAGFTEAVSGVETVGYVVLAPVLGFLYLIVVRVSLELVVVVFRIGETAIEVRDILSARNTPPGAGLATR